MKNSIKTITGTSFTGIVLSKGLFIWSRIAYCLKPAGLTALLAMVFTAVRAQEVTNYSIHANIIYHFTKYIDWPDNMKSGDFIIGVVGDTPLYEELERSIAVKKAGNRQIAVRKFSASGPFHCHILFISNDESRHVKKIAAATEGASILIVSEQEGLARRGACINFVIVDERLKLEINQNNIKQRELSIASELLQLGIPVK